MKQSEIFDRWMQDNAEMIEGGDDEFKRLVAFALLNLRVLEHNRNGISSGMADAITKDFNDLKAAFAERGVAPPAIEIPKIKVVRPGPPRT